MNVETGTVDAQFLFWEYLFSNFCYWFFAVRPATSQARLQGMLDGKFMHVFQWIHPAVHSQ